MFLKPIFDELNLPYDYHGSFITNALDDIFYRVIELNFNMACQDDLLYN